ncbi:putative glycosyl hydrolase [Aureobasidium subglaciale]|nr:putative glycosyl hydrolase [Aureobasidium subglaciale]
MSLVAQMTLEEKVNLTGGIRANNSCGGNIPSVDRLGFPGMCLADGPAVCFTVGRIANTCLGWNRNLTYARARAMAGKVHRKGITVALAPAGVGPLGRVAQGGRKREGFGNDPYRCLAGILAGATVRGAQEQGVIACTKHFIANEQEVGRNPLQATDANKKTIETLSTNIDARTMHELYMWPFADAIHAGTSSISRSLIVPTFQSYIAKRWREQCAPTIESTNFTHLLNGLLKTELGFQGFVLSDWSAQYTGINSALAGLDMVMPSGLIYWGPNLNQAVRNRSVPESRIDDMATKILTDWFYSGQDSPDTPVVGVDLPADFTRPHQVIDARDPADAHNLRQSAIEGRVLVKNINNALPLRQPDIISVFGYDARPIGIYNVGTDGRGTWLQGLDSFRSSICGFHSCRFQSCPLMPAIQFNVISEEIRKYGSTTFWNFETYGSNITVKAQSDVCLVFINAIAAEGIDRSNLRDDFSDGIVKNVADRCHNTVVVVHNAGICLVDQWIDQPNVTAVLFGHLPGQDSGTVLVDILFGRASLSGKLP